MHVYGLDHAIGLSKYVKDIPVMSLGKSAPMGISFDDKVALFENYDIKNKMASISFASEAKEVILLNGKKTQAKNTRNNQVTFTHVPKGRYWLIEDGVKIKRIKI
jgi:hypothetical protein